jgi:hypothetical protein
MGLLSRTGDTFYAFRFLRLLTTPWEKTGAFKAGILDDKGNVIRKPETAADKDKYNLFHRLVYNIKRTLNKIPFGKTTIASYLTALYLLKEHTGLSDAKVCAIIEKACTVKLNLDDLHESTWYLNERGALRSGIYILAHDIALPTTGEVYALKKSKVSITEDSDPVGSIFGVSVYKAQHIKTKQTIFVTKGDLIQ